MALKVNLPDTLANEAQAAGLLNTADRLLVAHFPPMTKDKIQAEVDAVRKARTVQSGTA